MPVTRTMSSTTFDTEGRKVDSRTVTYQVSDEQDNHDKLVDRLAKALDTNKAYRKLAAPTPLDQAAQVAELTRQNQALIRLVSGLLDATD